MAPKTSAGTSIMDELAERARKVLPAGGFGDFEPDLFIRSGSGSRVIAEDGREYIDYLISSGPMILGHGHPEVNAAIAEQLKRASHSLPIMRPG